jgi:hypothetical protein
MLGLVQRGAKIQQQILLNMAKGFLLYWFSAIPNPSIQSQSVHYLYS